MTAGPRTRRLAFALAALALSCETARTNGRAVTAAVERGETPRAPPALVPGSPSPLAPAQTLLTGPLAGETLTETESCAGCHVDAAAQWRSSAHAYSSFNNPVYRVSVDRFRRVVGKDASRFCAACHDVALLIDGAMSGEVEPADPRAHGGVTCRVCHGVASARPDGNGSYALDASPIPIPRDGDPESLRAHKERMALAPLRTAAMCGSCHRSFLSPETGNPSHLAGQDEFGAWSRSVYAGSLSARIDEPIDRAECRTCHMPLESAPLGDAAAKEGRIRSHRFAGANTWLAAMRSDGAQVEAVRRMLRAAASVDVAAVTSADGAKTLPADGAPVRPGEAVVLDVVVRNEHAGHRFPGGVLDAQDTWIEVEVTDRRGRPVAAGGAQHESSADDRAAHQLLALQADPDGVPVLLRETDRFRTPVYNHTIAPRDAEVVRYRLRVPDGLARSDLPLQVVVRLQHRSRNLLLQRAVCDEARAPRGAAFGREARSRSSGPFDACAREPVTEVARGSVWIGDGAERYARASEFPDWRRLYDHALGLLHALQEDVGGARASLAQALSLAPQADERARAMVLQALAQVATREGRTDEALAALDEAEGAAPEHPALARARGDALAGIWKWKEAEAPLRAAAEASPLDDSSWSRLAVAYGSAGAPEDALRAARWGFALNPRDADMLRVQALALDRLSAPPTEVDRARAAFARWAPPDDAPGIKSACARAFSWCALERVPVHVHDLEVTWGRASTRGRAP